MFDLQQFESESQQNGIRYWLAHDFMSRLGYESWQGFKTVIQRAMSNCLALGIDTDEVFIPCDYQGGRSYRLTRFACFLIAMQADGKKPEVVQAQVALAAIAEALIEEKLTETGLVRIEERGKLTQAEKFLGGIAKQAGIESRQFGIFKDAGIRGMYNMSLQQLQSYKGADGKKPLYDFMGITEMAANTFRLTQTAERIKNQGIKGLNASAGTARDVGQEVREVMLKSSGTAPEDLPLEGDIASVKKQIKSANKHMKKLDGTKKPKA